MTLLAPPATRENPSADPAVRILVVLALVAAELVWAWYAARAAVAAARRVPWLMQHAHVFQWTWLAIPLVILAVFAGVSAGTAARRLAAVASALAAAGVLIAGDELIYYLFTHEQPGIHLVDAVGYTERMTAALLAALAWCVARRSGVRWVPGLVVAPVLTAGLVRWHWRDYIHVDVRAWNLVDTAVWMVPIVLACLACWLLEHNARTHLSARTPQGAPADTW